MRYIRRDKRLDDQRRVVGPIREEERKQGKEVRMALSLVGVALSLVRMALSLVRMALSLVRMALSFVRMALSSVRTLTILQVGL
jgi:hypothetical protein